MGGLDIYIKSVLQVIIQVIFVLVPPLKILSAAKSLPKSESVPIQQQDVKFFNTLELIPPNREWNH